MTPGNGLDAAGTGANAGTDASELRLIAAWVAAQMDGSLVSGDAATEFADVSIDSRTLKAGALYVGVRGERFDGADFAVVGD